MPDPGLRLIEIYEGRRPGMIEAAEPGLKEPPARVLAVKVGKLHQRGDEGTVIKDKAAFRLVTPRRDLHGLKAEGIQPPGLVRVFL